MRDAGFTLVEVLASLLVFSIAIIGLTKAGTESARALSVIEGKMLAGVVADNQLVLARQSRLETGTKTGEETVMDRAFEFELITSETEVKDFFQLTVKVSADETEQVLVERTAFRKN